jgi:7,8-dihydropterin-6-yl-methyl-4-(beta-D-ribofuranosyl)aminobenzene 5'-phosphate synthase
MAILAIDPSEIPTLFISHEHGDHTAGIPWILECNPSVNCYLPSTYAAQLESRKELPVHAHGIGKPTHLYGPFYSTGDDFRAFHEQGLVVKTGQGGLLLTGCGHPGVVEMVKVAEEDLGIRIHTVIGGLHLLRTGDKQLGEICDALKMMGVRKICPTHCTGDHAIAYIKRSFGEGYIPGGTGREIIIQPD